MGTLGNADLGSVVCELAFVVLCCFLCVSNRKIPLLKGTLRVSVNVMVHPE